MVVEAAVDRRRASAPLLVGQAIVGGMCELVVRKDSALDHLQLSFDRGNYPDRIDPTDTHFENHRVGYAIAVRIRVSRHVGNDRGLRLLIHDWRPLFHIIQ